MKNTTPGKPDTSERLAPKLYRIAHVGELLEISNATIYRMIARGELDVGSAFEAAASRRKASHGSLTIAVKRLHLKGDRNLIEDDLRFFGTFGGIFAIFSPYPTPFHRSRIVQFDSGSRTNVTIASSHNRSEPTHFPMTAVFFTSQLASLDTK